eukprot:GFUD01136282.1.p1 GENE.GFUD01136282.1~~GFUD01136282.1.p1  ORF type:complete len:138 (-),score=43.62 GFUD01136282.1:409-822(-)
MRAFLFLVVAFSVFQAGSSCLRPCRKLAETCGLLNGACCSGLDCVPLINRCSIALGKKKRSSESGCSQVVSLEKAAFAVCNSDGADGLTWAEVEECEAMFASFGVPLPTKDDFQEFDLNGDGNLLFDEWQKKIDCEP